MHTEFWLGNLEESGHSEHLGVDWKTILKQIIRIGWGGRKRTGLIYLGPVRAFVNKIMNLRITYRVIYLPVRILAPQYGLRSTGTDIFLGGSKTDYVTQ